MKLFSIAPGHADVGKKLVSNKIFETDEILTEIKSFKTTTTPTYTSVQIDANHHIEEMTLLRYLNHSCKPNVFVETKNGVRFIALKSIKAGDELTFFYPSTEWSMVEPFTCFCGADTCLSYISGANDIPTWVADTYRLNTHIINALKTTPLLAESST